MFRRNIFLVLFLLVNSAICVYAQNEVLKFNPITSENGLPQNTIHGIAKDKYGFMWIGTWGGLCKYDGYNFKIYQTEPGNDKSLNSNRIHNIIKDKEGNIWVLTFKEDELCRYNYATDNFERVSINKIKPSFNNLINRRQHFESVKYADGQFLWDLKSNGNLLQQTELSTKKRFTYEFNPANRWSLTDSYVTDLFKDDQNLLWIGTYNGGLNKTNINSKFIDYLYHDPANANSLIENNIKAICEDHSGNLWVGTRDKGITFISKNGYRHFQHQNENESTINHNEIKEIYCDSKGTVWIGTKRGLDSYNPATGNFNHYTDLRLNYYAVHGITEDNQQNLWLATWNGIYMYNRTKSQFINFDPNVTLKNQHAKVVLIDNNGLFWVGTEGGGVTAFRFISKTNRLIVVKQYQHQNNTAKNLNCISDNRINCILQDKQGKIWIGTGNGLDCITPKTNKIEHFSAPNDLAEVAIAGMVLDKKGNLWVSHRKGITKLNTLTRTFVNVTSNDGLQGNEFSDNAVLASKLNSKIYFGGNNGLNAFNPDNIKFDSFMPTTVLTQLQILNKEINVNEDINGRIILSKPIYLTEKLTLTHSDKSFSISFSALNFANPKGCKYAYMLEGFDKNWIYTDATNRTATYSNLDPGDYNFLVKSSNSNGVWSKQPKQLSITIEPPFYASIYAMVFYLLLATLLIYLYHYYASKFANLQGKLAYEILIKEKENELYQGKLQFFTNISHEIKTPLTLILAPLEKLSELCKDNKQVVKQVQVLKSSGDRLLRLVNQLLDFRKLETGNTELNLQKRNIIQFINEVLIPFKLLAEQQNLNLYYIGRKHDFYLLIDADKLEKVLSNLLTNALKFTNKGSYIEVRLKNLIDDNKEIIRIEIINLGQEIPKTEYQLIFQPFAQSSSNKDGGTGIGLAYVKALINLQGGKINVSSEKVNENTFENCFTIDLPVNTITKENLISDEFEPNNTSEIIYNEVDEGVLPDIQNTINEINTSTSPFFINGKIPTILITEDNSELRTYLQEYLGNEFQVISAENGLIALQLAKENLPDLIISDIMMPEMDGMEFCSEIKSNADTAHIPVILLTAKSPVESQIEGFETGADEYIVKPFNLSLLTARIRNILTTRSQLKEKYRKTISFEPSEKIPVSPDEKLLQKILKYVEDNIADTNLSVESIGNEIGLSRAQLYRKVKAITGLSLADVIKEIRFKRAKQLLKDRKFNVNEVVYMVGFSDVDYFRKCFKAEFGITPSDYFKGKG